MMAMAQAGSTLTWRPYWFRPVAAIADQKLKLADSLKVRGSLNTSELPEASQLLELSMFSMPARTTIGFASARSIW
jgi:hypothetical protein